MLYSSFAEFKERAGYDIAGAWYPRVTSILSIKAKPGLLYYYASMPNYKTGRLIASRSADEGTAVHDVVEAILNGESPSIPSPISPAIDAFLEFCRNNDIRALKTEDRIISHKHKYAGTMDALAEINGTLGVLDIKTSQAVYRDFGIQTSAYVKAIQEDSNTGSLASWILRLDQSQKCEKCSAKLRSKGGNAKVRGGNWKCAHEWSEMQGEYEFVEMKETEKDFNAFLAAKELWTWEHKDYLNKLP